MCGFAGAYSLDISGTVPIARAMSLTLDHRGPDTSDEWISNDRKLILVHTRLSILDLSNAGNQPMLSASGRYIVVYNGEIYNHINLRVELKKAGFTDWRGHSDTETLLACIEVFGLDATLSKVKGMYAFAIYDLWSKKLYLVRDRFGEKPLYWGWQGQSLLFGSELKALKVHPSYVGSINKLAIDYLSRYNYIPAPLSIIQGVQKLSAGKYIVFDLSKDEVVEGVEATYWELGETDFKLQGEIPSFTYAETLCRLKALLENSVQGQLLSDVPVGAFLSGGVDSSLISAIAQKYSKNRLKTFTIGFEEKSFDESRFASEVASYIGSDHTDIHVGNKDLLELVPKLSSIYCEPFADSSQLPTFLVSKLASNHVKVVLSGDGADEFFGGYNHYRRAARLLYLQKLVPQFLKGGSLADSFNDSVIPKLGKLLEVVASRDAKQFYSRSMSNWRESSQLVLGIERGCDLTTSIAVSEFKSLVEQLMFLDSSIYLPDDILVKVDRAAMANSLETRIPFLDVDLVRFAQAMPLKYKIKGNVNKLALRDVLASYIPRDLFERPKKGFSVPLGQWMRGPLRDWIGDLLNENLIRNQGIFNQELVAKSWALHLEGKRDYSRALWGIVMFQAWLAEN